MIGAIFILNLLTTGRKKIPLVNKLMPPPAETNFTHKKNVATFLSPVPQSKIVIPMDIGLAPTYQPGKGEGIDINSKIVTDSISEIAKLESKLPYETDLKLSTRRTVSIIIPSRDLEPQPWILTVQIFGIDYISSKADKDYSLMKNSFREAAAHVFFWIKENGVEPEKIIVSWGDKAYIQDIAKDWLKSP